MKFGLELLADAICLHSGRAALADSALLHVRTSDQHHYSISCLISKAINNSDSMQTDITPESIIGTEGDMWDITIVWNLFAFTQLSRCGINAIITPKLHHSWRV